MHKQELVRRLSPAPRAECESTLSDAFSSLCLAVDSPRSLAAWILFREKEYEQLVSLKINPDLYSTAHEFADDYLVTAFLSKFPDFSHENLDPEKAALASFHEYEAVCADTNRRFRELELDPSKWDPLMRDILYRARRKIAFVLGDADLDRISDGFGWGPGATSVAKGHYTSAYIKYAQRLDITSNSLVMGRCCVNSTPPWVNCQLQTDNFPSLNVMLTYDAFNIVRGNEIVLVPKNAKTHRVIAKEPHVNSYLQKGFGREIRRLLRLRAGIDLKDQSRNQELAKEGSLTGSLATLDLKGASDTISYELVKFLLPSKWFSLLCQVRSPQGYIQKMKRWVHYEKFSSMGNACTFELESLIFWALCKATLEKHGGEQTLNVYGDDLIVPVEHYSSVVNVIHYAGFLVNLQKSFSSGRFRESCGKDYFDGIDVRPLFLKESIAHVESIYRLANGIRRYSHRRNFGCGCDIRFLPTYQCLRSRLDPYFRGFLIPEGFGDSGLIANFDEACPPRPQKGWGGFTFRALTRQPVKRVMSDPHAGYTAMLSALGPPRKDKAHLRSLKDLGLSPKAIDNAVMSSRQEPLLGHHDLRRMTYPKVTRIHTHGWYDLGPWQ